MSLKTTIDNVLTAISPDLQRTVAFKCESVEGIEVLGDALELELLMRNLIKNTFEAAASAASDNTSGAQEAPTVSVRTQIRRTKRIVQCSSPSRTLACR